MILKYLLLFIKFMYMYVYTCIYTYIYMIQWYTLIYRLIYLIGSEISPGCSLEGLMLKLKLQYFGHLMRRADSLEKTLMLGGIGGRRKRGRQRMRRLDGITDSMDMSLSELRVSEGQGGLVCCDSWGHKESDTTEWLNWTEHKYYQLNMVMKKCLSLSYSSFCCWLINQ